MQPTLLCKYIVFCGLGKSVVGEFRVILEHVKLALTRERVSGH